MTLVVVSTAELFDSRPRPTPVCKPQSKKTKTLRKVTVKKRRQVRPPEYMVYIRRLERMSL